MTQALLRRGARPLLAVIAIIAAVLVAGGLLPHFASTGNLMNILLQAALVAIPAFGVTLVILTGGIDLSVGATMSVVGVLEAALMTAGMPWPLALVIGLATGAVLGTINGVAVAWLRLPAFIATFGTSGIAAGIALYLADVSHISLLPQGFVTLGNGAVGAVSYLVIISLAILVGLELWTRLTHWGVWLRGLGDAPAVAKLGGVKSQRTITGAYIASGLFAAVSGTLLAANLGTAGPLQGDPYTLSAIAACVVGGIDLFGGRGKLWAAGVGAIFLAALKNALNLQGIQPFMQNLVIGCLIVAAVFLTTNWATMRTGLSRLARVPERVPA